MDTAQRAHGAGSSRAGQYNAQRVRNGNPFGYRNTQGPSLDTQNRLTRRGHSDGDVIRPISNLERVINPVSFAQEQEADSVSLSMSGQNQNTDIEENIRGGLPGTRERAEMILADRMKRMSRQQDPRHRRRAVSSMSSELQRSDQRPWVTFGSRQDDGSRSVALPPQTQPFFLRGGLDRPLPLTPNDRTEGRQTIRDVSLPGWQPDTEVASCPICHTSFTFWYRKHHCRKCGRVVCANCSPHRITIPRQFIVHPPEESPSEERDVSGENTSPSSANIGDETATILAAMRSSRPGRSLHPVLGGGQEVRLCNPCVPDPNLTPHASSYASGPQRPSSYHAGRAMEASNLVSTESSPFSGHRRPSRHGRSAVYDPRARPNNLPLYTGLNHSPTSDESPLHSTFSRQHRRNVPGATRSNSDPNNPGVSLAYSSAPDPTREVSCTPFLCMPHRAESDRSKASLRIVPQSSRSDISYGSSPSRVNEPSTTTIVINCERNRSVDGRPFSSTTSERGR